MMMARSAIGDNYQGIKRPFVKAFFSNLIDSPPGGVRLNGRKIALFAFTGEKPCFVHVMLNALDLNERGYDVKVVIEGAAARLVKELPDADPPLGDLYRRIQEEGLLDCVCQACAHQMTSLESAKEQGLALCNEMSGHPAIGRYMEDGYTIVTF
jgi:hypothetical protein